MANLADRNFSTQAPLDKASSNGRVPANPRRFRSIKWFVFFSGILMCTQSALSMYTKGVLTSIERQFQISSSLSGLLVGSFNVGNVLFVVLVSQLCSKGSRPRCMAIGAMVVAIGGFLNAIPHAITPVYDPDYLSNITSGKSETRGTTACGTSNSYMLIFAGEMLQGIGAATLVPLGSSYVDDFAEGTRTPIYIGVMLFLQNMGPGMGFLIGSLTTTVYVDFDKVDVGKISIDEKNWIGAWWLGYIIIGILVILSSLPLFWFPAALKSGKREELNFINPRDRKDCKPSDDTCRTFGGRRQRISREHCGKVICFLKSTFITVQRLLCDPLYLCVVLGYSALMFTVGTLTTFMPKFLETVFYQSKSRASFIFGMSMPLVLCLGLVSGGLVVQKAGLKTRGKMIFACVISAVTILLCAFSYLITCDVENAAECFGADVIKENASSCFHQLEVKCSSRCYTFVAIVSLAALLACNIITPYYSVILSTVQPQDKSTAIGLKFLVIRVLALIPSPVITGAVIDGACITWSTPSPCIGSSVCLEHDRNEFRYSFLNIIFSGVAFTFVFNLLGYFAQRSKRINHNVAVNKEADLA